MCSKYIRSISRGVVFAAALITGGTGVAASNTTASNKVHLRAKSSLIDAASGDRMFVGDVDFNRDNLKIRADQLREHQDVGTNTNNGRTLTATGNPARVTFRDDISGQTLTASARLIRYFPSRQLLQFERRANLKIFAGKQRVTEIKGAWIELVLNARQIRSLRARGNPVTYRHRPELGPYIIASAQTLALNAITGEVNLVEANVSQGDDKVKAHRVNYNSKSGQLSASGEGNERLTITLDVGNTKNKLNQKAASKPVEQPPRPDQPTTEPEKKP